MGSPLFPNFGRYLRQAAQFIQQAKQQGQPGRAGIPPKLPGGFAGSMWQSIIRNLGPWGAMVDAALRGSGGKIDPALEKELEKALADAMRLVESQGYDVTKRADVTKPVTRELIPESPTPQPASRQEPRESGPRQPEVGGRREQEPDDIPDGAERTADGNLVEWVIVNRSSNVHSFAYEWNPQNEREPGNLLVRFLGGDSKHRAGPGSLYRYHDVPRPVFVAFKLAASKGGFVWDELRVRGTVAGHQYSYDFAGNQNGYVPRQAVVGKRGRGGPAFVKRTYGGRQSPLAERQIRGGRNLTRDFRGESSRLRFKRGKSS